MTDQGNDPTRADVPQPGAGADDPTQVGMPPVDPTVAVPPPTGAGGIVPPPYDPRPLPGGEPPDRRPWIIAGLMAVIAIVAIALLLLGGDDEDDDTATTSTTVALDTTTSSDSTTTTVEATTTTEAPTTTTTEAPPDTAAPPVTLDPAECAEAGQDPGDPQPAALAVYEAWTLGDESCAGQLMSDEALTALFDRDGAGADDQFQGCFETENPEPATDCAFTYPGGSTHFVMVHSATDGWQVVDVFQNAD